MILHICYNDSYTEFFDSVQKFCEEKYPDIQVLAYNEDFYNDRKKSFKIKGGYSARLTPFMLLTTDEKAYLQAFYSEDKGCTLPKLEKYLNSIKNENSSN